MVCLNIQKEPRLLLIQWREGRQKGLSRSGQADDWSTTETFFTSSAFPTRCIPVRRKYHKLEHSDDNIHLQMLQIHYTVSYNVVRVHFHRFTEYTSVADARTGKSERTFWILKPQKKKTGCLAYSLQLRMRWNHLSSFSNMKWNKTKSASCHFKVDYSVFCSVLSYPNFRQGPKTRIWTHTSAAYHLFVYRPRCRWWTQGGPCLCFWWGEGMIWRSRQART